MITVLTSATEKSAARLILSALIFGAVGIISRPCGKNVRCLCETATLSEFRKRGIMSALIEYSLNDAKSGGDIYAVLLPANEGLYRYYASLGYRTECAVSVAKFSRSPAKSYTVLGKSGEGILHNSNKEKYEKARALTNKPLPKDI